LGEFALRLSIHCKTLTIDLDELTGEEVAEIDAKGAEFARYRFRQKIIIFVTKLAIMLAFLYYILYSSSMGFGEY
jgi:hypothetical protein